MARPKRMSNSLADHTLRPRRFRGGVRVLTISILTLSLSCATGYRSESGPTPATAGPDSAAAAPTRPLFDGQTLDGWHVHGEPNVWRAENGEIVGELVAQSPYAYLVTDEQFDDFELTLEMLFASEEGNSGIFFRCSFPPQCASAGCNHVARALPEESEDFRCPRCGHTEALPYRKRVHIHGPQVEFAPQNTGGLYDSGGGGWINKDKLTETVQKMHHLGEWNDFRLEAVGDHVSVYLNGFRVSDVKDHPFAKRGHFALQLHAGGAMKVRFRNIHIRPAGEGEN